MFQLFHDLQAANIMNLSSLFQRSVQQYGQRPALALGTNKPLTYAELNLRVRSLAHWLRHDLTLERGDRVMLAMKNHPAYAELLLACWHAGLCVVPVNAKLHVNEIGFMLHDSGARVCLTQGTQHQALADLDGGTTAALVDIDTAIYRQALDGPGCDAEIQSDLDPAWIFYTSGTTGRPKGVVLSHANMVSMAMHFLVDVQALTSDDVLVHVAPMSHGSGLYSIPYLLKGGLQVVPESGGLDEAELEHLLDNHRNASLFAAPTIVTRLVQYAREHGTSFPGLRCLLVGGAPFYAEDIRSAVQTFGSRVAQVYGQGETPMTISAMSASQLAQAVVTNDETMLGATGFVMSAIDVEIIDEAGQRQPAGVPGEVVVRGPTVMAGYWHNDQATARTIIEGALRTGDIGLLDERGLLHLKDRSKDVIISGGTNIYPREVEEILLRHAAVEEVSVVGMPDPKWGESVVAFIVFEAGRTASEQELDTLCIENIARFKRPKRYVFVAQLPKNGTGKVLKRALQKQLEIPS